MVVLPKLVIQSLPLQFSHIIESDSLSLPETVSGSSMSENLPIQLNFDISNT